MLEDYYRLKHVRGLLSVKTLEDYYRKNICKRIIIGKTYVRGSLSVKTYVRGLVSVKTYVRGSLSVKIYVKGILSINTIQDIGGKNICRRIIIGKKYFGELLSVNICQRSIIG